MSEKVPDTRIKYFTDYFFEKYEAMPCYKRKPAWSGKEAKLLQTILKSFDARKLTTDQLKGCIDKYLQDEKFPKQNAHAFSVFAVNPDKYLDAVISEQKHGEAMIKKAQAIFAPEPETLRDYTMDGLVREIEKKFKKSEEECIRFMRGQRYMRDTLNPQPGTKVHTNWVRSGQAARIYFGDEMVNKCWKSTAIKDKKAAEVKKQAQEILQQKNLTQQSKN